MRNIVPLIILMVAILGCGRFGAGSDSGTNSAKSNTSPGADKAVVDMPNLVGKSTEEIKTIVGIAPRYESPYLSFELPKGELTVDSMKGEQTSIGFKTKGTAFTMPAEIGDLVGIDLRGNPVPEPSGEYLFYKDVKTKKGTLKRVTLHKTGANYDQISIDFNLD